MNRRRDQPAKSIHLYAFAGLLTRRVKIGRASIVSNRFKDCQSLSADTMIPIGWAADCGDYEERIHDRFMRFRLHGEWFSPELTALIVERSGIGGLDRPSPRFAAWVRREVVAWQDDQRGRMRSA